MTIKYLTPKLKHNNILKFVMTISVYSLLITNLWAQENNINPISKSFQEYTSAFRELAYCHLNKSTFIKGEMLGFSSYITDKNSKTPSKTTKNLYCVIQDSANRVVKSKLIKIESGFANNVFSLDSLFTSGNYTFKAYTNWMNNFEERNIFTENFRVIDPSIETNVKREKLEDRLDAQFLPEGGHFVDKVKTNVGVVIKDSRGYGVPNIKGNVYDSNNKYITTFKTNSLGLSRFLLFPESNQKYKVKVNYFDKLLEFNINNIVPKGISLHVNDSRGKLALEFKTNTTTLKEVKNKPFKLMIHNGKTIKEVPVKFKNEDITIVLNYKYLFTGINIFTLFNSENEPVLERLFFNHKGINIVGLEEPNYSKKGDSIQINIPFKTPFSTNAGSKNVSVSVLPETTQSYKRHQNIISYNYLQPYVKGYIENASYYFTDVNSQKAYELDNLLITQGWSSYNWDNIFNKTTKTSSVYEDGIVIKGNKNNSDLATLVLYPLENEEGTVIDLSEDEKSFEMGGFYPMYGDTLKLSVLNKRGIPNKANLYLQFSPSKISNFKYSFEALDPKTLTYNKSNETKPFNMIDIKKTQKLDRVLIKTNIRQAKIDKLKSGAFDRVYDFDDAMRATPITLVNYINSYILGFKAEIELGEELVIYNTRRTNRTLDPVNSLPPRPLVYLDDIRLNNLDELVNFDMRRIDYIVARTQRTLDSPRTMPDILTKKNIPIEGAIKIYTSNEFINKTKEKSSREFKFPLTFSKSKKFYAPKYYIYNDDFFKEYGVIDWIPNCTLDSKGNLNFTVYNPTNSNIKLFIEGITEEGDFLSEMKVINTYSNNQ